MAVSQNGWEANNRSLIGTFSVPGGSLTMRKGDISIILLHLVNRYHNEVQNLIWPGCWGYAEKTVTGANTTTLSNHASGTAVDMNAPLHPQGTPPAANYTTAQITKIHEIVNFYEGVIRWGGDYVHALKDGMHFEINVGPGSSDIGRIVNKINNGSVVTTSPAPVPPTTTGPRVLKLTTPNLTGEDVKQWQDELWRVGVGVGAHDGIYGPATASGTRDAQGAAGIINDGIVGSDTKTAIAKIQNYPKPAGPSMTYAEQGGNTDTIKAFQQRLKDRGWDIIVDGDYGGQTERVISAFQKEKGLTADGVGNADTWIALWTRSL